VLLLLCCARLKLVVVVIHSSVTSLESDMELCVWQKGSKSKKPELLGRVFLTLFDLKVKGEVDTWHTLDHHTRRSQGQVHVKIKYHDPSSYADDSWEEEEDITMV